MWSGHVKSRGKEASIRSTLAAVCHSARAISMHLTRLEIDKSSTTNNPLCIGVLGTDGIVDRRRRLRAVDTFIDRFSPMVTGDR